MGQNINSYDGKMEVTDGRILIIDDESGNIAILERVLKGSGFNNIKSISDSRLAVTTYDEYRPDLVLLDLNMPHVTGFEVIDQLKKAQNGNHLKEKKGTGFEPRMVDAFKKVLPEMVKIVNRLADFAETNGEKHLLKIFPPQAKNTSTLLLNLPLNRQNWPPSYLYPLLAFLGIDIHSIETGYYGRYRPSSIPAVNREPPVRNEGSSQKFPPSYIAN